MSVIPTTFVESVKQRIAELGAACKRAWGRTAVIESGPGKGLRFDAGPNTQRFTAGKYERPVQEAIAALVKPGDVCYDIGANLGFFSILLGRFAGATGSVYAFEPVPQNASTIERNARLNRETNIEVLRIALSNHAGMSELLLADNVGGAVLKSAGIPPDIAGSLMVETASIDTFVESRRIKPPNFVKIDVESAELEVLQGMERVLRKWSPTLIIEVDDETAAGCEEKLSLYKSFLHDINYRTEPLPDSYAHIEWNVHHFLAVRNGERLPTAGE